MGNVFKHISDLDAVKKVCSGIFEKIEESEENLYDEQAGKTIRIEETYELTPVYATETTKTIIGDQSHRTVKWDVMGFDYNPGVHMYPDGSGEPPSWDERELGTNLSFSDAIMLILSDWIRVGVDASLENLDYEDMAIDEKENPEEWEGV